MNVIHEARSKKEVCQRLTFSSYLTSRSRSLSDFASPRAKEPKTEASMTPPSHKIGTMRLANFSISFFMNILILIGFKVIPSWKIVFFPLVVLPLFFLGAAIGLITSMIAIVAVDISRIIIRIMGLMMFVTPIIYSDKVNSALVQAINKWNPITYLVCSARDIIIYGRLYHAGGYAICALLAFVLFMLSWRLFYVSEDRIIERMI